MCMKISSDQIAKKAIEIIKRNPEPFVENMIGSLKGLNVEVMPLFELKRWLTVVQETIQSEEGSG
mgnify:CR=1 FL=1